MHTFYIKLLRKDISSANVFVPIRKPMNLQIGILSFRFAKQIRMSTSS